MNDAPISTEQSAPLTAITPISPATVPTEKTAFPERPPSAKSLPTRWYQTLKRHRWKSLVGLLLFLAAAGGGGVFFYGSYHWRKAQAAMSKGDVDKASHHVQIYLDLWPRSIGAHLLAARVERLQGHFKKAEDHLTRCHQLQQGASDASQVEWFLLRSQLGEFDKFEKGLLLFVKDGHPSAAAVWETLAGLYLEQGRFFLAGNCAAEWLKLEPDNVRALEWHGMAMANMHQRDVAFQSYERILELNPDKWIIRLRLADFLLEEKNPKGAEAHLEKLWQSHSEEPEVMLSLASLRHMQGKLAEARQLLEKTLALVPDAYAPNYYRGKLELQAGKPGEPIVEKKARLAKAEKCLITALKKKPGDFEANYTLAQVMEQLGRLSEAKRIRAKCETIKDDMSRLEHLLMVRKAETSQDPQVNYEVGHIFSKMGHASVATYWLYATLRLQPDHRGAHQLLAEYFESKGEKEKEKAKIHRARAEAGAAFPSSPP